MSAFLPALRRPSRGGPGSRGRLTGLVLALAAEALLVLLLLTLSPRGPAPEAPRARPNTFALAPETPPEPEQPTPPAPRPPTPATPQRPTPQPPATDPRPADPAPAPAAAASPPAIIPVAPGQLAAADLAAAPQAAPAPPRRVYGPPDRRSGPPDTPRVEGSGPNGEPLYAAAWYREPYPEELRGYLSTARGPGWALIACRTVKDFHVEDCAGIAEYPERSGMLRAVLAAAWQFRVRPPIRGGQYMVGDWVRIRIDYELRAR
jgi:periplasmic protein TonB